MFRFPKSLYTDVRIENVYETKIIYTLGEIEESKVRNYKAAFIRVFDGERWYYSSTTDIDNIQNEIDSLATYGRPNKEIYNNPIVKKLQVNNEELIKFQENDVSKIEIKEKHDLIKKTFPILEKNQYIKHWKTIYVDEYIKKEFYSSKGSKVIYDSQFSGFSIGMRFSHGNKKFTESYQKSKETFKNLDINIKEIQNFVNKCENFLLNSKPVKPGKYTVILSPETAGIFAHESFGHKSEADLMLGDAAMEKEWTIGKKVGSNILSIVDDGNIIGRGYVPFDDEGTKSEKTYLIKDGVLKGRLHSATTANSLDENLTGNARATNFMYEPIVRMTTTYIEAGDKTKEELFSEVEKGIFIDTFNHGTGMSTFTIAPSLAYYIRNGKIAEPVNISVITGNVMETLKEVNGLSNEVEITNFILGGCGKMEQQGLPIGFGGPYVRVKNMDVQ